VGCALFFFAPKAVCYGAVADMTAEIPDAYLAQQFRWAFVVDLPDANSYLKYDGATIWPITKVRVNLRTYTDKASAAYTGTLYETLWYHYHLPAGLRRYNQIALPEQSKGAIVVCPGYFTAKPLQRPLAITDTIVRLAADITLRHAETVIVLVPQDDYDCIAEGLREFHFFPQIPGQPVVGLGIFLRGYPNGSECRLYLQKP
jgi:hypothetical protein